MKKKFFSLLSILLPLALMAQIVPVGSGSYTTQLPPADAAGRNVNPNGTPRLSGAALTKPVATSDWWTGLLTFNDANMYNYPLSLKGSAAGLIVSYTFLGQGANDTRQPMGPEKPLVVGVSGITNTYPTVSDYSDWTVTASWNSGASSFNATMGMGMPFVYCTKGNADIASVTVNTGTVAIQNEMLLVTNSISGSNYAVYAPSGSVWNQSGTTYTSTLAGKNYFSVAMLPPGNAAATTALDYKKYAYVFPSNTNVNWQYDNTTSIVQSTYTVTADIKEGTENKVLLGLLPHQWAHLGATSNVPGNYTYTTSRGVMKMLAANSFIVENKFKGVLSTLPNMAKYSTGFNPDALNQKIDMVKGGSLDTWTDSYNEGLAMNRLIQVAKIADQTGNKAAREQIIKTVKTRLENWFKADAGENAFLFYYNTTWSTLIGYPAGYYSDANLNDHHFHYGYFISAAAAIEQFEPGWAAKWGGMVNMLVKDAANWDKTDNKFPFLRNFNAYAGHSFATGLLNNEPHGNNQESSSEAMNFNASLIHWGEITGNTAIRDLGIYLYTTEQTAVEEYWFNMNNRNFAATYTGMMCSRVWSNGYDKGTFWTSDIAAMYGIEMFPLTGSSLYLGHNTTYVQKLWNDMKSKTGVISNTANDNLWFDIYWSYLAMADPATAITLYNNYPTYKPKGGCSDAQTYHWLHSFNGMGQIDATLTANYPIAAVFNKGGDKTYVVHNYGATEITVTFSDGYSMVIPPRTMKTSKDVDITATVSASLLQVPTNGSTLLTATVTGTNISKVEFYDGTNLLASTTTAPYTATASSLAAKVHGFYAKVYSGSTVQLSNVVSVIVGARLPYSGTAISIPSQVIESGNYDIYEGGIGQNITYFDVSSQNEAGTFRSPEYVDAAPVTGEGNAVSYINDGEWLTYTVNVEQAGTYDLAIRYSSGNTVGGGPFHIEADGATVINNITVPYTDKDWKVWATKTVSGVILPAGQHVIRLFFDKAGFNIGKISFTYKGVATPNLNVSTTDIVVAAPANSTKTFDITSNIGWKAISNQSWLTVTDTVGFGNATVTVTALENADKTPRTAVVTITGNGVPTKTVNVTQTAGGVPYLVVSKDSIHFAAAGSSAAPLDITANVAWNVVSNQSWLTVNKTSGTGIQTISITAADNILQVNRTGTITITGDGLSATVVKITQDGAPLAITFPVDFESSATYTFTDFDGGVGTVIDNPQKNGINTSNRVGKIIRNAGATWAGSYLTLSNKIDFGISGILSMKVFCPRAGMSVLFKLESDGGAAPSEVLAKTTVANAWETLTWDFTGKSTKVYNKLVLMFDFGTVGDGSANSTFLFDDITQNNLVVNTLSVSPATITVPAVASTTNSFDISSTTNWTAVSDQAWLTINKNSGTGNATILLNVAKNDLAATRTANVVVTATGVAAKTVIITQEAAVVVVAPNAPTVADVAYCKNTTAVALTAGATGSNTLLWYTAATGGTGSASAPIPITTSVGKTDYYVSQVNANTVESPRAKITVTINDLPAKPIINWDGIQLSTNATNVSYQWLLNNAVVTGATLNSWKPKDIGNYSIQITDINTCKNVSDAYTIVVTAVNNNPSAEDFEAKLFPNPANKQLLVQFAQLPTTTLQLQIVNNYGQIVKQVTSRNKTTLLTIADVSSGTYYLKVIGKNYHQVKSFIIIK